MSEKERVPVCLDLDGIKKYIPHREPFLMIDHIIDMDKDKGFITGGKTIDPSYDVLKGHFPGNPVYPGVLILEGMAQVAAVWYFYYHGGVNDKVVFFAACDNVKFKRVVLPNDLLIFKLTDTIVKRGKLCEAHAEAYVLDELAASADLKAFIKPFNKDAN